MNATHAIERSPWQKRALILGLAGAGASALAWYLGPQQFFRTYLIVYSFWLGLSLGCLALALLHQLAGGRWGAVLLRPLEAGAQTIYLMAVLFLPVVIGLSRLYPWADAARVASDALLQHKQPYLNVPFFLVRAGLYFAVWIWITHEAVRRSKSLDLARTDPARRRLQRFSALGLVLLGLTATFAAIDWLMSLEPHWYSAIYGTLIAMGAVLAAFAFGVIVVGLLRRRRPLAEVMSPRLYNDFGSLLLAFVMLWAYLALSQFLVIWSANLSEDAGWYLVRLQGAWQAVILGIVLLHFALPFVLLLSNHLKRSPRLLMAIAALVLLMRFVDSYWLIAPSFHDPAYRFSWLDASLPLAAGGLWLADFLRRLEQRPLLPRLDPRVQPHAEAEPSRG